MSIDLLMGVYSKSRENELKIRPVSGQDRPRLPLSMKTFYIIENFNNLANLWVQYNFIQYKTLQTAKNEVKRFKANETKDKLRVIKTQIVYEKK